MSYPGLYSGSRRRRHRSRSHDSRDPSIVVTCEPPTCPGSLTFSWATTYKFSHFEQSLSFQNIPYVSLQVVDKKTRQVIFNGLKDDSTYIFTLSGIFKTGSVVQQVITAATTLPEPYLGTNYIIKNIDNIQEVGETITADIVIFYNDYNVYDTAPLIQLVHNGTPLENVLLGAGSEPTLWNFRGVTSDQSYFLDVTCSETVCSSGGLSTTIPALYRTMPFTWSRSLIADPPATPLLSPRVIDQGPSCLTFAWTAYPQTYAWYSTGIGNSTAPTIGASEPIIVGQETYYTFKYLVPNTLYDFTVVPCYSNGNVGPAEGCSASTLGTSSGGSTMGTATDITVTYSTAAPYTASIKYTGFESVSQPCLSAVGAINPATKFTQALSGNDIWTVGLIDASTTLSLVFTAIANGSCYQTVPGATLTLPFSITTPGTPAPTNCCNNFVITPSAGGSTSSSLTFTWTMKGVGPYPTFFQCRLYPSLQPGTAPKSNQTEVTGNQITFHNLAANTTYYFTVAGKCDGSYCQESIPPLAATTAGSVPPDCDASLRTFTQSSINTVITFNDDATVDIFLIYPASLQKNVSTPSLVLADDPSFTGITLRPNPIPAKDWQWDITGLTASYADSPCVFNFTLSAIPTCDSTPITLPLSISVYNPADDIDPPFNLVISHYSGAPQRLNHFGSTNTVLVDTSQPDIDPATYCGGGTAAGSWFSQFEVYWAYATAIVTGFVDYHLHHQVVIQHTDKSVTQMTHLPITLIFYGQNQDPCAGGGGTISGNTLTISQLSNYALSTSTINSAGPPAPLPDTFTLPNLPADFYSFQYPTFLTYFIQMIQYNWNQESLPTKRQVELALTNYGSDHAKEEWWFNCTMNPDGSISTNTPSNPKGVVGIVDGIAYDGNYTLNSAGVGYGLAGWNCMERWFMQVGYLNQQLRKLIDAGCFVSNSGATMTLGDLSVNPSYYQISAITCDSEGNGFSNTMYTHGFTLPFPNGYNVALPTTGECDVTMTALWDKWVNQSTVLPASPPGWWNNNGAGLTAAAARKDGTTFKLKCRMSMTTPGLLPHMKANDLGSYNSISHILNEIYDTSDSSPFYFLGASATQVNTGCGKSGAGGAPFSPAIKAAADGVSGPFAAVPETYAGKYGTWDNLIPAPAWCSSGSLAITDDNGTYAISNSSFPSALTAFNGVYDGDSSNPYRFPISPLLNNSTFTPWNCQDVPNLYWTPEYYQQGVAEDINTLAWALESSRYDLYNGAWAYTTAGGTGGAGGLGGVLGKPVYDIDYSLVTQGCFGADGALMISDLSTGLKCRVANIFKGITTASALVGQVWMLSTEACAFVNTLGVRGNARGQSTPILISDLLTFSCPPTSLNATDPWPGWYGMQGQYYGVGTSKNAGKLQMWSLDQLQLAGKNIDPSCDSSGVYITPNANSSENNYGVFSDPGIIFASWLRLTTDLLAGMTANKNASYAPGVKPLMGCYELGFLPLTWFNPDRTKWMYIPESP